MAIGTGIKISKSLDFDQIHTFRSGLNDRILEVTATHVSYSWKDYAHNYQQRTSSIKGEDFLRLFAQHILPSGFTRIRHYGFLSSASKAKSLMLIRKFLRVAIPTRLSKKQKTEKALKRMGIKAGYCSCGGKMHIIERLPNRFKTGQRAPPVRASQNWTNNCKIAL